MIRAKETPEELERDWSENPRWREVRRDYSGADVLRLRGSVEIEYTLARLGAEKLWRRVNTEDFVPTLGALTGGQAVQQVKAGVKAIYLSGWQVAADANLADAMYPDQSLYPVNSVPSVVRRINNSFRRADEIQTATGKGSIDYFVPIVADAEAGFGGVLNAFELMRAMIDAGAGGVHFEDDPGADFLAILCVGDAEYLDLLHRGMAVEKFFDLARIDVVAPDDDHFLLSVD